MPLSYSSFIKKYNLNDITTPLSLAGMQKVDFVNDLFLLKNVIAPYELLNFLNFRKSKHQKIFIFDISNKN